MARTIRNTHALPNRDIPIVYADLDITSYTTGGESITAADVGLRSIEFVHCAAVGGRAFEYLKSTALLKSYTAAGVEVVNATNIGVVRARFEGR